MPLSRISLPRGLRRANREQGQLAVLILGLFVLVLALILGAIDVTAAQLARMRLLDTADSLALDASDALDQSTAYGGVDGKPTLTDSSVQRASADHLARTPKPTGITEWSLDKPTGSPDGGTAVVTLSGHASLPMTGWILEALGGGVTITVTSRARAPLQ
jgi:hypothetical protein